MKKIGLKIIFANRFSFNIFNLSNFKDIELQSTATANIGKLEQVSDSISEDNSSVILLLQ